MISMVVTELSEVAGGRGREGAQVPEGTAAQNAALALAQRRPCTPSCKEAEPA